MESNTTTRTGTVSSKERMRKIRMRPQTQPNRNRDEDAVMQSFQRMRQVMSEQQQNMQEGSSCSVSSVTKTETWKEDIVIRTDDKETAQPVTTSVMRETDRKTGQKRPTVSKTNMEGMPNLPDYEIYDLDVMDEDVSASPEERQETDDDELRIEYLETDTKRNAGKEPAQQERPQPKTKKDTSKTVKKKKRKHRALLSFLVKIGITAAVLAIAFTFLVTIRIVHNNDMYPAIRNGQLILVSRVSELLGDTVVLYRDSDGNEHLGRVIGLGDQEIVIQDDSGVSVNRSVLYQTVPYDTPKGKLKYPYIVPTDSYFILNDYREQENDSRIYGAIPKKDIIGVVIFAIQYREF